MKFAQEEYLWALLALPLLIVLYLRGWKRREVFLHRFASAEMIPRISEGTSKVKRMWKAALMVLVMLFVILALARPQWGRQMELVEREGLDIVLLQDLSLSMMAEDVKPNRLTRARHEISDFLSKLTGDRVGLVGFAGDAQLMCPLTLDYGAVRIFLNDMQPDWLMPGTDIAAAMQKGIQAFEKAKSAQKYSVMVLLTDGEEHDASALKVAEEAAQKGITIYTVGIGSRQGVPIPVKGKSANGGA